MEIIKYSSGEWWSRWTDVIKLPVGDQITLETIKPLRDFVMEQKRVPPYSLVDTVLKDPRFAEWLKTEAVRINAVVGDILKEENVK